MKKLYETYRFNNLDTQGWRLYNVEESDYSTLNGEARLNNVIYALSISTDERMFYAKALISTNDDNTPGYIKQFDSSSDELVHVLSDILAYFTPPGSNDSDKTSQKEITNGETVTQD